MYAKHPRYHLIGNSMVQETVAISGYTDLTRIFDFAAERISEVSQIVAERDNYERTPIGVAGSGCSYSFNEVGQRKIDTMYELLKELCKENGKEPIEYGDGGVAKRKKPAMRIGET